MLTIAGLREGKDKGRESKKSRKVKMGNKRGRQRRKNERSEIKEKESELFHNVYIVLEVSARDENTGWPGWVSLVLCFCLFFCLTAILSAKLSLSRAVEMQ